MIVQLVSHDDRPWSLRFNKDLTVLQPYAKTLVEWEKACFWFGDPGLLDERRRDEYNRRRSWFDFHLGFDSELEVSAPVPGASWETKAPRIQVIDPENGGRILMVLDDPDGTLAAGGPTVPQYDPERRIAELEEQMRQLVARLGTPSEAPAPSPAPEIPVEPSPTGIAGLVFTDPDGNPILDDLDPEIPSASPDTASVLSDEPAQVGTGTPAPAKRFRR